MYRLHLKQLLPVKSSTTASRGFSSNVTAGATNHVATQGHIPGSTAPKSKSYSNVNLAKNNYSHIAPSLIQTVDFICYINFLHNGTEYILKYYSDVQTQGMQYNVVLHHINDLNLLATLPRRNLPTESIAVISGTLINKFLSRKVVMKDYLISQNLLKAIMDGFVFLKQILMIKHPQFTDVASGFS